MFRCPVVDNDNKEILDIVNYDIIDLILDFFKYTNMYSRFNINIQSGGLKIMSDIVKELMPYLEKVAEKLSATATNLWQLQVQQGKVILISGCIQYLVLIGISVVLFLVCRKLSANWNRMEALVDEHRMTTKEFENETFGYITIPVIIILAMIIYYIFRVPSVTELSTIMFNPEYWALQEILKMVK